MITTEDIIAKLEKRIHSFNDSGKKLNVGTVMKNTDGVITADGLSDVAMGEIVTFENGNSGVVLNLDEDTVSIILLGSQENLKEGNRVETTGKLLSINVSNEYLGRTINPLGNPLDGKPDIKGEKDMPLERIAPGVVEREPVNTPVKTGIKAIDAMIPIGRGQRELIIGDRGLGKTAIAIDTIINQRIQEKGHKRVICIYVAIGQKRSTVAQIVNKLKEEKALPYTIIVVADASDPASFQYLAPYAGCAIAEYFMEKGEDVLIVYDDLTKHAWAYRQLSLVLRRPAGREAYPGDVFYLHSRLLERAVKLNKEGHGSITALPIIETQAGDISAYIPTNVISITDGQIFLEADLFNSGIRPAINVGNSVSRVGGSAQTGGMKSVAGKMRLELAQYQELAAFAQFGSELDKETLTRLERGKRTIEIFKQAQYRPVTESLQIAIIWTVSNGHLDDIPLEEIQRFEEEFSQYLQTRHKKLLEDLGSGTKLTEPINQTMEKAVKDFKQLFHG
ncbi:MAG: F0F1 ATP synthase subunit alpha [Candidatus Levybacteria bacterium RIFCSPHIGHO2_02_FULL_42_12]|nr:MAG: F0F1 ATP synthase subunit alpha [Candidatus Levybacteria bacterium RIFCSPHIGHO2_02_FULL_42_12]